MKSVHLLVSLAFILGVCFGDERGSPNTGNVPKPPMIPQHENNHTVIDVSTPSSTVITTESKTPQIKVNTSEIVPSKSTATTTQVSPTKSTSTTSTPSPSTTSAPPEYGVGSWNVTEKGKVCILLKGEIELNLVNEVKNEIIKTIKVPKNAPNHGSCSKECIEFELPDNSSLHLMFEKDNTSSKFYLHAIKANLSYILDNQTARVDFENNTLHLFENPLDQSYYCAPASENIVAQKALFHLTLKVSDFQVQAFKNSSSPSFDTAVNCESPHTPDIVPIVVGCALAILVICVLVAYLISRRRSQSRGYLSM